MLSPIRSSSWPLAAMLALSTAACGDHIAAPVATPGAARMLIMSGNAQTVLPGGELPQPIVVKVVDENGDPVPNQIVNFKVAEGGGSVWAGTALTNAQGLAQEHWTLGSVQPGSAAGQRIEVRAVDSGTGEKQVFARFTAFALQPPLIGAGFVVTADSINFGASLTRGPYTYVWDLGDNTGTFRRSGEVTTAGVGGVMVPKDRLLWFCYYARTAEGLRSAWMCAYTGPPYS